MKKLKYLDSQVEHPLYSVWSWMKTRCYNKNDRSYINYWWRWITVSSEWKHDMIRFILDMEDEYFIHKVNNKTTHIDRIDNNKWYSKENCRFVTAKINCRNTRKNIIYKWKCLSEWSEILGIDRNKVSIDILKNRII